MNSHSNPRTADGEDDLSDASEAEHASALRDAIDATFAASRHHDDEVFALDDIRRTGRRRVLRRRAAVCIAAATTSVLGVGGAVRVADRRTQEQKAVIADDRLLRGVPYFVLGSDPDRFSLRQAIRVSGPELPAGVTELVEDGDRYLTITLGSRVLAHDEDTARLSEPMTIANREGRLARRDNGLYFYSGDLSIATGPGVTREELSQFQGIRLVASEHRVEIDQLPNGFSVSGQIVRDSRSLVYVDKTERPDPLLPEFGKAARNLSMSLMSPAARRYEELVRRDAKPLPRSGIQPVFRLIEVAGIRYRLSERSVPELGRLLYRAVEWDRDGVRFSLGGIGLKDEDLVELAQSIRRATSEEEKAVRAREAFIPFYGSKGRYATEVVGQFRDGTRWWVGSGAPPKESCMRLALVIGAVDEQACVTVQDNAAVWLARKMTVGDKFVVFGATGISVDQVELIADDGTVVASADTTTNVSFEGKVYGIPLQRDLTGPLRVVGYSLRTPGEDVDQAADDAGDEATDTAEMAAEDTFAEPELVRVGEADVIDG